jgi:hypothetical protein
MNRRGFLRLLSAAPFAAVAAPVAWISVDLGNARDATAIGMRVAHAADHIHYRVVSNELHDFRANQLAQLAELHRAVSSMLSRIAELQVPR